MGIFKIVLANVIHMAYLRFMKGKKKVKPRVRASVRLKEGVYVMSVNKAVDLDMSFSQFVEYALISYFANIKGQ